MNCPEVRTALPEFVYGSLPPEAHGQVESHLSGCPDCRREAAALRRVRSLLDAAPAPPVRLDAVALYREAADRQGRRLRRWRRVALAGCAAAVALLMLTAVVRLEVHVEADQMVVRWGPAPTPTPAPPASPVPPAPAPLAPPAAADTRDLAALEERVRTLSDLVQALAEDGRERDYQRGQEMDRLRRQVAQWQGASDRRWNDVEKDFGALYIAQFPDRKGVQP